MAPNRRKRRRVIEEKPVVIPKAILVTEVLDKFHSNPNSSLSENVREVLLSHSNANVTVTFHGLRCLCMRMLKDDAFDIDFHKNHRLTRAEDTELTEFLTVMCLQNVKPTKSLVKDLVWRSYSKLISKSWVRRYLKEHSEIFTSEGSKPISDKRVHPAEEIESGSDFDQKVQILINPLF